MGAGARLLEVATATMAQDIACVALWSHFAPTDKEVTTLTLTLTLTPTPTLTLYLTLTLSRTLTAWTTAA